jgi:hypothetical protein
MVVSCSPDIFQAKISELMATLEFVRAYIDELLCITKGYFDDHLAKLKLVLQRLQDVNLKVGTFSPETVLNLIPRKYSRFLH